jgi:Tol biopolymer transport system component
MNPPFSIAHYRITAKLGAGGMGTVYRATDTKLGRNVAVKVLPDSFAADPDRLARFTREAQVLASLNHPGIAAIHGVEERALIMELVEGSTLAGPLPEADALPVVHQLIDALEYAHDKGIVHRDLKPDNIKLTPEGRVKVLDFGLAKALASEPTAGPDAATSPTLAMQATMTGAILGTAAYMAPEQARGQNVDRRADIWAFGAVVYELLTGTRLFEGTTVPETLASVLRQEIDLSAVPARFRRLLRACLERDPRRRMRDIGDARLLLEEADPPSRPAAPMWRSSVLWPLAAIPAVVIAILAVLLWVRSRPADRPLMRFETQLPPDAIGAMVQTAVISPDGQRVAFRIFNSENLFLATRRLDEAAVVTLPGTELVTQYSFSPDNRWLAFATYGKLLKTSVLGGTPISLCDMPDVYGLAWLPDGSIVAVAAGSPAPGSLAGPLVGQTHVVLARASGGPCQTVLEGLVRNPPGSVARWPQSLPDGDRLLFTTGPPGIADFDTANIEAVSLETGRRKILVRGGYFGRYLPTGHLIYIHQGALYGIRLNLSRLETEGSPAMLIEQVAARDASGAGDFDVSANGTLVYHTGKPDGEGLDWLDQPGKRQDITGVAGSRNGLRLSPDGGRVASSWRGDIFVYDLKQERETRLTYDPAGDNRHPIWTPDGRYLAYSGSQGTWWIRADGPGQPVRIAEGTPAPVPFSFTAGDAPKRLRLAVSRSGEGSRNGIWILPLDLADPGHPAALAPEAFLAGTASAVDPAFSPDGRWLAYSVEGTVDPGIYVRRYHAGAPAPDAKWIVSGGHHRWPVWSRDTNEILFRSGNGHIMTASYTARGEDFAIGRPHPWSNATVFRGLDAQDFDIEPGGRRALVRHLSFETSPSVVFLLNFFDEVRRRIP